MNRCRVVGNLWATRKSELLNGFKLVILSVLDRQGNVTSELIVAVDILDVHAHEEVLITFGSGARNVLENQELPVDAVITGIVAGAKSLFWVKWWDLYGQRKSNHNSRV